MKKLFEQAIKRIAQDAIDYADNCLTPLTHAETLAIAKLKKVAGVLKQMMEEDCCIEKYDQALTNIETIKNSAKDIHGIFFKDMVSPPFCTVRLKKLLEDLTEYKKTFLTQTHDQNLLELTQRVQKFEEQASDLQKKMETYEGQLALVQQQKEQLKPIFLRLDLTKVPQIELKQVEGILELPEGTLRGKAEATTSSTSTFFAKETQVVPLPQKYNYATPPNDKTEWLKKVENKIDYIKLKLDRCLSKAMYASVFDLANFILLKKTETDDVKIARNIIFKMLESSVQEKTDGKNWLEKLQSLLPSADMSKQFPELTNLLQEIKSYDKYGDLNTNNRTLAERAQTLYTLVSNNEYFPTDTYYADSVLKPLFSTKQTANP